MSPVVSWLMTDSVRSMSKDAFWGGSLLTDDELIGSLHEIGAFSLEELATLIDELEETLLETLEFACASLELERASFDEDSSALDERCSLEEKDSLDEEFSLAMLDGLTGISLFDSVQPNQKNAVHERNIFPTNLWIFLFTNGSFEKIMDYRIWLFFR